MPKVIPCEHNPKGCPPCRVVRDRARKSASMRRRYEADSEKFKQQAKAKRLADPDMQRRYKGMRFLLSTAELWVQQKGLCNMCETPIFLENQPGYTKKNAACADHNHQTGWVRRLLCFGCNSGLGFLKDHQWRVLAGLEHLCPVHPDFSWVPRGNGPAPSML